MSAFISKESLLLATALLRAVEGDLRHQPDQPIPKGIRSRLDEARADIEASIARLSAVRASAHDATQHLNERVKVARETLAAVRRTVYAMYSDKDKVVEDYGFRTRSAAKRKKDEPKKDAA